MLLHESVCLFHRQKTDAVVLLAARLNSPKLLFERTLLMSLFACFTITIIIITWLVHTNIWGIRTKNCTLRFHRVTIDAKQQAQLPYIFGSMCVLQASVKRSEINREIVKIYCNKITLRVSQK
jgi:hypothetical protein